MPDGSNWQATKHTNLAAFGYVAFGEDASGELYVVNRSNGRVYHLHENSPVLSISKQGPIKAAAGEAITYTLTITNHGNLTATNVVVTDTIPTGATYIPDSGGTEDGPVVNWTIDSLPGNNAITQTTFAVTAAQTIVKREYWVSADGAPRPTAPRW